MLPPITREMSSLVANAARLHIAETPASNLYLSNATVRAGTVFAPEHDNVVVAHDSIVSFVDDEPTKNWGHKCRYLMHDPQSGSIVQEALALMPPSFTFGQDFKPVHIGTPTMTAVDHPVLPGHSLPPWIFRDPSQWYAILYSGLSNNRHLNDIEFLYRTLVHSYGVPKANITVLNFDGTLQYNNADWTPHAGSIGNWPRRQHCYQVKINGKGTKQALADAIAAIGKKLKATDNLLIHTNNHGGQTKVGNATVSTLCAHDGPVTLPSDFGAALAKLPKFQGLMVMMEQCFSGGFIDATINNSTASCTSIATAVDANTSSDGGANFDPYALAWISAMAGQTEAGGTLSPAPAQDASHHVTAQTAFDWSKTRGGIHDNPQFKQNVTCGGALTLAPARSQLIAIPPLWKKLWPWQILPDPSPEQIVTLGDKITAQAGRIDLANPRAVEAARGVDRGAGQGGTVSLDYAAACAALLAAVAPGGGRGRRFDRPPALRQGRGGRHRPRVPPRRHAIMARLHRPRAGAQLGRTKALTVVIHDNGHVEIRDAQFPPALSDGRRLRPLPSGGN